MIIGLTGKKGHGKDAAAEQLVEHDGYTRVAFADALKESAAALFGVPVVTWDALKNNADAQVELVVYDYEFSEANPGGQRMVAELTVREFLQRYGTEAHREIFADSFWLDVVEKKLRVGQTPSMRERGEGAPKIVVTDCRFDNEAALIRKYGGVVIEIHRPQVGDDGDGHASEIIPQADALVINDGTFAQLRLSVLDSARTIFAARHMNPREETA